VSIAREHLERLARKYETLASLRRARAAGEPVPGAAVFRRLASEFPGSLNELDTLPLDVIDERARALQAAAAGGEVEPWMEWLAGYHALLRAALFLKPRVARRGDLDDARADELVGFVTRETGVNVDASFVRGVAHPPGGRLVAFVFARLAEMHGRPAASLKRALFPRSRR
jgi:hypothetical protein